MKLEFLFVDVGAQSISKPLQLCHAVHWQKAQQAGRRLQLAAPADVAQTSSHDPEAESYFNIQGNTKTHTTYTKTPCLGQVDTNIRTTIPTGSKVRTACSKIKDQYVHLLMKLPFPENEHK